MGKTSITKRFVTESFTSAYMHTIGIDFDEKVVEIGGKRVRLQVRGPCQAATWNKRRVYFQLSDVQVQSGLAKRLFLGSVIRGRSGGEFTQPTRISFLRVSVHVESRKGGIGLLYDAAGANSRNLWQGWISSQYYVLETHILICEVWDTAGQERFRTMIRPYYRGAAGIILVYDVTDARTFESISEWMRNIEENTSEYQVIQKVLVGNKTDMAKEKHAVTR